MDDINIALLIDADNVSAKYISTIISELSKYGKITIRRMYGDWSQDRLHAWLACSSAHSLTPIMQPNNTPGKNASDIGLIIDAMDILYRGEADGFCIASSDGDFNYLAKRLREAGKVVVGMGEKKTPESFRVSCERFVFLDVIYNNDSDDDVTPAKNSKASGKKKASSGRSSSKGQPAREGKTSAGTPSAAAAASLPDYFPSDVSDSTDETDAEGQPLFTDKKTVENAIIKIISDNSAGGYETSLGEIGSRLDKMFPDFDVRNYHYSKLSEFVKDFPSFQVTTKDNTSWVTLKGTSESEIEQQIKRIYERHKTKEMDIGTLRAELTELNPNLDASIKKSGVTRFNVYLNRMIKSVEVSGSTVTMLDTPRK